MWSSRGLSWYYLGLQNPFPLLVLEMLAFFFFLFFPNRNETYEIRKSLPEWGCFSQLLSLSQYVRPAKDHTPHDILLVCLQLCPAQDRKCVYSELWVIPIHPGRVLLKRIFTFISVPTLSDIVPFNCEDVKVAVYLVSWWYLIL